MFQYTREIIINDQTFEKRENASKGIVELFIPNVGSYRKDYIKGAFYTAAKTGSVAELALPTSAPSDADVIKFTVKLKMQTGDVHALLANYTTLFTRGIIVEVAGGSTAAEIKRAFIEALRGMEEWPIKLNQETDKIVATTPYLNLQLVTEKLKGRLGSISEMVIENITEGAEVKGVKPFGTYECLVKDNRLPTMENIRPWGEAQEEYPVRGAMYDLIELTYVADRNIGGFDVLGQKATSVTKHRFWVRQDRKAAFIAALEGVIGVDINGDATPAEATVTRATKVKA